MSAHPAAAFGSNCFETPFQFSGHKAAYTIGPFVGYRVQFGNWVVGLEGDWSYKNSETSLNQSSSTSISVSSFSGGSVFFNNYLRTDQFSGSVKQKSDSSIRARVGMLVTPWSLLYVTGGVAFGEISGSFAYSGSLYSCSVSGSPHPRPSCASSPSVATATTAVTWSDTRVGSTVGARLGNRDRARLEGEGRVPLHGLRQLHQDLRSGHPLHRQL